MAVKLVFRKILAHCFHHFGVFSLLKSYKTSGKAFVLMYHRVIRSLEEQELYVQPGMYILSETLREQLAYLKSNFTVLPLSELVKRRETGQKIDGCCAITYDDGWRDNFLYAFPVLQEFGVPATVFLATAFIGTEHHFWPEKLFLFLKTAKQKSVGRNNSKVQSFLRSIAWDESGRPSFENAVAVFKAYPPREREKILEEISSAGHASPPKRLLMNWEEAREMLNSGLIDFGAHTANHVILDQIPLQEAEKEILRSKEELEHHLDIRPDLFAYPNGNYNRALSDLLKKHGFRAAVTTRRGWFNNATDLFQVPRIGIHEDISNEIPLFGARILLNRF